MPRMTGGQALVRSIHREGVRVVFGLPGVQLYHALDAFHDEPDIPFITTRHEQATAYMADGYARAGGTVGTAMVVPGPGLQNASAAIGTAYAASSPVLVISGQINRDNIGRDVGILHEVNDQLDIVRPITKWRARVLRAKDVPGAVHEAFYQLRTGRPRPVEIEIPPEALAEEADVELLEPSSPSPAQGNARTIEEAAGLLLAAQRPIVWAGGGVHSSGAWQELLEVAEHLQAPVITTAEGKGAISDRHPLSLGVTRGRSNEQVQDALRGYFSTCDVTLAVGTRFATAEAPRDQQVVQVDIDEEELGRNHAKTLGILGDAKPVLRQLVEALRQEGPPRASGDDTFEDIRSARFDPNGEAEPLGSFVRAIRGSLPDDGILVPDMTQVAYYSRAFYPVYSGRTYLTSSYYGNLGFAYPTALGAKVAQPGKPVVAVCGDGGFLFNSQEMATAVQHGIGVVAVVFNDSAFGNVLRDQQTMFNGRVVGSELRNPDFLKLAEAYGIDGVRAEGPDELKAELARAISKDEPALIEVPVGQMPSPF